MSTTIQVHRYPRPHNNFKELAWRVDLWLASPKAEALGIVAAWRRGTGCVHSHCVLALLQGTQQPPFISTATLEGMSIDRADERGRDSDGQQRG